MAGFTIVERQLRGGGEAFHLRLTGGRYEPVVHLGAFPNRREAERAEGRARLMLEEGVMPSKELVTPSRGAISRITLGAIRDDWLTSLVDLADTTQRTYAFLAEHAVDQFGKRDVRSITPRDVQTWLVGLPFEPRSLPKYRRVLAAMLDYAQVYPNPARDKSIRVPRAQRREYRLPTRDELDRIRARMHDDKAMAIMLLEHTGLRCGEACALKWTDRDAKRRLLFVREAKTPSGRRLVKDLPEYPPELIAFLDAPSAKRKLSSYILGGVSSGAIAAALRYGCIRADVRVYSPHDLRHLHASRLHDERWTGAEMAARLGHANAMQSLTTYTHVLPPE